MQLLEKSLKIEIPSVTVTTMEKSTLTEPTHSESIYEYFVRIITTWSHNLINFLQLSAARIKNKMPVIS